MAVHQALMFHQLSSEVSVLPLAGFAPTPEQREQLEALEITVLDADAAAVESDDDGLAGVRLTDGRLVELDAVVVGTRSLARAELLAPLGLVPTEVRMGDQVVGTVIEADPTGATAVPGVWVAGNVANVQAQVISSAAAGLAAGAAINADLIAEEARHAVEARKVNVP